MKNPFGAGWPDVDIDVGAIDRTITRALASAGLDTTSGPMRDVTETVRRSLAHLQPGSPPPGRRSDVDDVVDVVARRVPDAGATPTPHDPAGDPVGDPAGGGPAPDDARAPRSDSAPARRRRRSADPRATEPERAGRLAHRVHVPAAAADGPRPMIVMLHGCTQSADDFAAGTRMDRLADEHGFIVVYPEQSAQANASRCWNWFRSGDQRRGAGEPARIAALVGEVAREHGADPGRIYVAGLSAGAAMAVVLAETYPELFSGVGVHSGLPYGSAHDVASAMAAMKGGRSGLPGLKERPVRTGAASAGPRRSVPLIVFHGDRDHTVQASNADRIVAHASGAHAASAAGARLTASTHEDVAGGRRYTCTVHADDAGRPWIEHWTVHGAGHAWSGGDAAGSYTDAGGPDASAEMVRFFLAIPRTGSTG